MEIAIVEDDNKIREELEKLLERNNYKVIRIESFNNVCQELNNYNPDLILLDINLLFKMDLKFADRLRRIKIFRSYLLQAGIPQKMN